MPQIDPDNEFGMDFATDIEGNPLDIGGFAEDTTPDLPSFEGGMDFSSMAPVSKRAGDADNAADVEDHLLELMEQGRVSHVLALTGECTASVRQVAADVHAEFSPAYARAAAYNPAIRWYGKLARALSASQFNCTAGQLTLSVDQRFFSKVIGSHLADFGAVPEEDSPIVSVVQTLARRYGKSKIDAGITESLRQSRKASTETQDFNPSAADFSDAMIPEEVEPDFQMDEPDPAVPEVNDELISLGDLSNRAIADFLMAEGGSMDQINERLSAEGMAKDRQNQIEGMIRYMRLNKAEKRRATGSYGGDVNFTFR